MEGPRLTSPANARRAYAYTIPRNRWFMRVGVALSALMFRLLGSDFRPYVHDPEQIEAWVTAAGFILPRDPEIDGLLSRIDASVEESLQGRTPRQIAVVGSARDLRPVAARD